MTTIEAMKQADAVLLSVLAVSPDSINRARLGLQEAIAREEAQTVEPCHYIAPAGRVCNKCGAIHHPAPSLDPVKPVSAEREALIAELRRSARIAEGEDGWDWLTPELTKAADMLAANEQEIEMLWASVNKKHSRLSELVNERDALQEDIDALKAQQVAVPQDKAPDNSIVFGGPKARERLLRISTAPQPPQGEKT